jgi:hypothetical protein
MPKLNAVSDTKGKDNSGKSSRTSQLQVVESQQGAPVYRISRALIGLTVPLADLVLDPDNANDHPEVNIEAIKQSLAQYGQKKPIVVRKKADGTLIVIAGNGTVVAARALKWTHVAANVEEMSDIEAVGYGVADNQTARLAQWNHEVLPRLMRLMADSDHPVIGFSDEQILAARAAEWTPPPTDDTPSGAQGTATTAANDAVPNSADSMSALSPEDEDVVSKVCVLVRSRERNDTLSRSQCLAIVCRDWLDCALGSYEAETAKLDSEADAAISRDE